MFNSRTSGCGKSRKLMRSSTIALLLTMFCSLVSTRGATVDGTIRTVDADRDFVVAVVTSGRRISVDTSNTAMDVGESHRLARTSDLAPGMRIHAVGTYLQANVFAADRLNVIDKFPTYTVSRAHASTVGTPTPIATDHVRSIDLRGTVTAVDDGHGTFTVRVNNHSRLVGVNDQTYFADIDTGDGHHLPVSAGNRVSVRGFLHDDGFILADIVSMGPISSEAVQEYRRSHISGKIVYCSSGTEDRKITIMGADGRTFDVYIPAGASIREDRKTVPFDAIRPDETVRVNGDFTDHGFQAANIVITQSNGRNRS